jgi:internalin A
MSELANKLIAENKRTRERSLDLGNCGLTDIPAEVGELVWLESLTLASMWIEWDGVNWQHKGSKNKGVPNSFSDLALLANLTSLQNLNVSETGVRNLAPLANLTSLRSLDVSYTQVIYLAPLAHLTSLQSLDVSETQVRDLAPLAHLTSLQTLDTSNTQVSDLAPLASLTSLQTLDTASTQVGDLAPLAHLIALQSLNISNTQVSNLAPLAPLASLQTLNATKTAVRSLAPLLDLIREGMPVKWSSRYWEGSGLYIEDCPLTDPPREIVAQGNDAILNYFAERARGEVDHLYEAKMLVLGEGGAGKTSLVRRLYFPELKLPAGADTTRGIEIHKHEFQLKNGRTFRLNVWDFGGQQIYHATHQFFLTSRSLYLLLDDTLKDHKAVSDRGFRDWLELIDVFGGHSPTLIFQNEKGGRSKDIGFGGIVQRYDNVKELFRGNLENPSAADRLRDAVEYFAAHLAHIGEELPASWIKVRADIEQMASQCPYVDVEEYFKTYGKYLQFDRTKSLYLSRYLHDLGVFLHFQDDPLLKRTVILQNEWATTAVFRVLDDEAVKGKFGRFDAEDCARLWEGTGYDDMHPELLALMQKFELCYLLPDKSPLTWLAPQLLPAEKPQDLAGWARPGDLILRYKYVFLPRGVISRLTVRQHRFVRNPEKAWVTGVLFEQGRTEVLVEVLPVGDEIELRARGPEDKALLSVISADLDALNDSFKGLKEKVDKRIPCICKTCRATDSPHFYGYRKLLERKELGKRTIECEHPPYEEVEVVQLLDGVKPERAPAWAKDASKVEPLAKLRIFLGSSSELRQERDEFELYFRQQNDRLCEEGVYLEIVRWEHFFDAMSKTRIQDEYDRKVRECDVFVSLFFTEAGRFTVEEFDAAFGQFKDSGRPLIYTYFKDADVKVGSLKAIELMTREKMIEKLKGLGHYVTEFGSIAELKVHFRDQLPMIREKLGL